MCMHMYKCMYVYMYISVYVYLMATPSFHRPLITINDLNHNIMNNIIYNI